MLSGSLFLPQYPKANTQKSNKFFKNVIILKYNDEVSQNVIIVKPQNSWNDFQMTSNSKQLIYIANHVVGIGFLWTSLHFRFIRLTLCLFISALTLRNLWSWSKKRSKFGWTLLTQKLRFPVISGLLKNKD